jgi:hypothetical protein
MDMLTIERKQGDTEVITPQAKTGGAAARPPVAGFDNAQTSDAYELRKAVESARQALARAQTESRESLQRLIDLAHRQRVQFWTDTCREPRQARATSRQVAELHRQHGWRFLTPSLFQVQSVLEALDSAMPYWDREHSSLFFQTLELNFPGVLRLLPRP